RISRFPVDPRAQIVAPTARIGRLECQVAAGTGERCQHGHGGVIGGGEVIQVSDADDQRVGAAIEEEMLYRVAEGAIDPQTAEEALELRKTLHADRLVDRSAQGPADEGRDRRRHSHDRANGTGKLFNVDARVRWCYRHGARFSFRLATLRIGDEQARLTPSGLRESAW